MKVFTLEAKQSLPISLDEAWAFLSNPRNLSKITPEYMNFCITSEVPDSIYPGLIITYNICPIPNVPMTWVTEITQVKENQYFIDEQRFGPYKMWHHQHFLKEIDGGVEVSDLIHYVMPASFLGNIVQSIFVKKQLKGIFDYRFNVLEKTFGVM